MRVKDLESRIYSSQSELLQEKNKNFWLDKENTNLKQQINQFQNDKSPNNNPIETINKLIKKIEDLKEKIKKCPIYISKK